MFKIKIAINSFYKFSLSKFYVNGGLRNKVIYLKRYYESVEITRYYLKNILYNTFRTHKIHTGSNIKFT